LQGVLQSRVVVSLFGLRVALSAARPEFLQAALGTLPPRWRYVSVAPADRHYHVTGPTRGETGAGQFLLFRDRCLFQRAANLSEALEHLESDLDLFVAVHAHRRLFVHAGVVGWEGRAIIIPGTSRSGKTTLVSALLRAGASYYSDDHVVFDLRGRVRPYPKPLFVRGPGGSRMRLHPEAFGSTAGHERIPVGLVVVTSYQPGAVWQPVPLSPGRAAMALLANTPCARVRTALALRVFERALAGARTLAGVRGDADETARLLVQAAVGSTTP
jgi:hypothetical protein